MQLSKSSINPALKPAWDDAEKALKSKVLKGTLGTIYWQALPHGRGAGVSTYTGLRILAVFEKAAQQKIPVSNALVVRQHAEDLRWCIKSFQWAIDLLGLNDLYEFHLRARKIVRKATKATIYFKSAEELERDFEHRTHKVASDIQQIWFEETDEFQKKTVANVGWFNTHDVRSKGRNAIAYLSFNPKSASHWTSKLKNSNADMGGIKVYPSTYATVPKSWLGNAFFFQAEALKSSSPKAYRHEYLGEVSKGK